MSALILLLIPFALDAQPVNGVCRLTLENVFSATSACQANVPAGAHLRIRQVSAYCRGPIDRQIRTLRLETRLSNSPDDFHATFLQLRTREIRNPEVYAEYNGSQLADVYAAGGTRISASVHAGLGAPEPPITCEIRFQGTLVK
jgi:hypothetical protein